MKRSAMESPAASTEANQIEVVQASDLTHAYNSRRLRCADAQREKEPGERTPCEPHAQCAGEKRNASLNVRLREYTPEG